MTNFFSYTLLQFFQCPLICFGTRQRLLFITKRRNDCSTLLPPYSGRLSRRTDMSYYIDPALTTKVSHRFYGLKGVGLLAHIREVRWPQ